MYDDVMERLASLSYTVEEVDRWLINYIIGKVENTVKNECNIDAIPDGLHQTAVDMACGEFLSAKKGSGQLNDFDVEAAVKQVKEGDTTVTYAVADGVFSLDGLINRLMNHGKSQFATYRRFLW